MDPAPAFACSILPLSARAIIGSKLAFASVSTYSGTTVCAFVVTTAVSQVGDPSMDQSLFLVIASDTSAARTRDTGNELVVGLPNSLVTIGLVRLNLGAGLVGVLTEILGILGGVTTDSTAR